MSHVDDGSSGGPRPDDPVPPLGRYADEEFTAPVPIVVPDEEPTAFLPRIRDEESTAFIPRVGDEPLTTVLPAIRTSGLTSEQDALLARLSSPGRVRAPKARRTLVRAGVTAVAFILTLLLTGAGIAGVLYSKYNSQLQRVEVLQQHDPNIRDAVRQQRAENFLVIGSDSRAGQSRRFGVVAGARSDTTMLVHISPDHTRATVVSIPRDSWVQIPGCSDAQGHTVPAHQDMFNSAYAVGGAACTIATVQKLTGIAVTHYVEINFSGFQSMVNALGTVTVCSPQVVDDKGSGLRLHRGDNRLNGVQALAYVRARESLGDGSDLGRIKRQQMFLGAVLRQAMSGALLTDPGRLTSFLDAATKAITIDKDTTFGDLRTLASSLHGLDPRRVTFYTAPIADRNYTPPGTRLTGRVLLDAARGRILYDSVIEDRKPVIVGGNAAAPRGADTAPSPASPAPSPTRSTAALRPDLTAAQRTCSL